MERRMQTDRDDGPGAQVLNAGPCPAAEVENSVCSCRS